MAMNVERHRTLNDNERHRTVIELRNESASQRLHRLHNESASMNEQPLTWSVDCRVEIVMRLHASDTKSVEVSPIMSSSSPIYIIYSHQQLFIIHKSDLFTAMYSYIQYTICKHNDFTRSPSSYECQSTSVHLITTYTSYIHIGLQFMAHDKLSLVRVVRLSVARVSVN